MNVLWAGGEDIGFPILGSATVVTTAGAFPSGWSRSALNQPNGGTLARSTTFPGGAVTSAWLTFQTSWAGSTIPTFGTTNLVTFGLSGTSGALGVGCNGSSQYQIIKYDGTTRTVLATEGGTSVAAVLQRFDVQVLNYGASATVNVYLNGVSLISYTGDVTVSGMSNFDSVFVFGPTVSGGGSVRVSSIAVSDTDSRAIQGIQTLALTGAGSTNGWTNNTFTNINGTSYSDLSPASVNTTAADQQYTVTTPTAPTYTVAAVVITSRMAKTASAVPTAVKLGYSNGTTRAFGTGASKSLTTGFQDYMQMDAINPITGVAFTSSDLASLQLCLESA